jgi:hypothetical protein
LRVELLMTVLAGFAGGLAGTLWGGVVTSTLLGRSRASRPGLWHTETAARLLAGAALYGIGGAIAGFLFWLGWGLVAVVATPWPLIGALYGVLLWGAAALPMLGVLWLRLREPQVALAAFALEGLVACGTVGVLCAYVWHRSG